MRSELKLLEIIKETTKFSSVLKSQVRFSAAQSFSLLLCNFSLAFGANQTLPVLSHDLKEPTEQELMDASVLILYRGPHTSEKIKMDMT